MLTRINELLHLQKTFAIETTLSGSTYVRLIDKAKQIGYKIILLFFWLDNIKLAINRVAKRVIEGGHFIPEKIIKRRYYKGIQNLLNTFIHKADATYIYNNSSDINIIAETINGKLKIYNTHDWQQLNKLVK